MKRRAADLARRVGCRETPVQRDRLGLLVAAGFPDRVAQRRGTGRGRFRLRNGVGVRVGESDELAGEPFIVAVDVAGRKKDAYARRAAAVDLDDLLQTAGFDTEVTERLMWDDERNDVFVRVERHLGALDLGVTTRRPAPSADVTALLLDHVRRTRLEALPWTANSRSLQARICFVADRQPDQDWPDATDRALAASLEEWLEPFLPGATGRADLEVISVAVALDAWLGRDRRLRLDELLPTHVDLPTGRRVEVDYSGEQATVSSRAQDFFGMREHPTTLGHEPITVELLSPAGRVIQRTADLPGFWAGSWSEVRKDMAGRYPKHDWPKEP